MSSSFKAHDKHPTVNLPGCINNCHCGESEPEICSSAPSVPNWAHWLKRSALAMHPLLFFHRNHQVHIHTYTVVPALRCCNSPAQSYTQRHRKTLTSQLSYRQPPCCQQREQQHDAHLARLHCLVMLFILGPPEALHHVHPREERAISTCIYTRVHYFDTNKSMLSSSFPLLCKVKMLRVSLIFNYNWINLISNSCVSHLISAPKVKEKATFLIL